MKMDGVVIMAHTLLCILKPKMDGLPWDCRLILYLDEWVVPEASYDWSVSVVCVLTPAHQPVSQLQELTTKL